MHSLVLGVRNDENDKKRKEQTKRYRFLYKLIEINDDSMCVYGVLSRRKRKAKSIGVRRQRNAEKIHSVVRPTRRMRF